MVLSPCVRLGAVWWCGYMLLLLPTLGLVGHGPAHWAADRYRYKFAAFTQSRVSESTPDGLIVTVWLRRLITSTQ